MNDDYREFLKLKQGLIDEEQLTENLELQKYHIEKPVGIKAILENFLYHHKLHLVIGGFCLLMVLSMIFLSMNTEKPDMTVLWLSDDAPTSSFFMTDGSLLRASLEEHTPDFNENGNVYVNCLHIDLVIEGRNPQAVQGNAVKLIGELQSANALLFIGNKEVLEKIPGDDLPIEQFYLNLAERYPDNPHVTDTFFYAVNGSALAWETDTDTADDSGAPIPEDLYIVIRVNTATAKLTPEKAAAVLEQSVIVLDIIAAAE
ncbi:MAG: hypothetical protein FWG45_02945 [Oscillospiraceae bacterium]|nr:hypothetical protein [Oscillospiraceae bacterium]